MTDTPFIIDDPQAMTFRLNRRTLTDPAVLERELTAVFDKSWIYCGHESEIRAPGDFRTREVCGRPVIFARDSGGAIRVFLNACRHRAAMVCREPCGNVRRYNCFYHGWSYDRDGRLVGVPGEDSYPPGFDKADYALAEAPRADGYKGFWFISFNREAPPLADYLAGAKEYIDLVVDQSPSGTMEVVQGTQEYDIRANWKLLVENSIDGYHALTTHATYFVFLKDLGTDLSPGVTGIARDLGNGHTVIEYKAPWGRPIARWEHIWGEDARHELEQIRAGLVGRFGPERAEMMAEVNRNMLIFPNLVVNDIMAITIRTFTPVTPDYQKISAWTLAPSDEAAHLRSRRLDSFLTFLGPGGFATPDDVEALEVCQRGFATNKELEWSDISRGAARPVPSATDELQMRVFWRQWDRMLHGQADPAAKVTPLRSAASR